MSYTLDGINCMRKRREFWDGVLHCFILAYELNAKLVFYLLVCPIVFTVAGLRFHLPCSLRVSSDVNFLLGVYVSQLRHSQKLFHVLTFAHMQSPSKGTWHGKVLISVSFTCACMHMLKCN